MNDLGIQGYAPTLQVRAENPEAAKYRKLWETEAYREIAPGEDFVNLFLAQARPKKGSHVIDFGCGTGRAALRLHEAGLEVTLLDFARNCLDREVERRLGDRFRKHDLLNPSPIVAEYGYCTDVLEHIPPEHVGKALDNLLRAAQYLFLEISTEADLCGTLIGESLHLSVFGFEWWKEQIAARAKVIWERNLDGHALFYATAWEDAKAIVDAGEVNISLDRIRANVAHNCAQGWRQVTPHETCETEVAILGGGPSLAEFEPEIRRLKDAGAKIVTLNGAYHWALERGLAPANQIVVDARPFNARFTRPVRCDCLYFLASQCDPSVFEGLPKDRVYLWHAGSEPIEDVVKKHLETWWPVPGGSTVLLRAIPLLRMLGFHKFHLFGCDSCLTGKEHHAFAQPENDSELVVPITVTGGRVFYCHPWMASQAQEFLGLVRDLGDVIDLAVYGDGLLAHIVKMGAVPIERS